MEIQADFCARELLEVAPMVMHSIREAMHHYRAGDLSVAQFRTLLYIRRKPGASLSDVAEHLGLTPPSASKKIDGLVVRKLVKRQGSQNDRRRINLTLTNNGEEILIKAREETQARLEERVAVLPQAEIEQVIQAMKFLRSVFTPEKTIDDISGG
jgi:DNA-binding MarR family transcriptional regulator